MKAILRSAAFLAILLAGAKLYCFVEKLLHARSLGTSAELDAYLVAMSISLSMFVYAREVIEPVVLPIYLQLGGRRDSAGASRFAASVAVAIVVVGSVFVLAVLLRTDAMIHLLAPGLQTGPRVPAVQLSRVTASAGLVLSVSALSGILLNAHRCFTLPASGDLAMKAILAGFGMVVAQ